MAQVKMEEIMIQGTYSPEILAIRESFIQKHQDYHREIKLMRLAEANILHMGYIDTELFSAFKVTHDVSHSTKADIARFYDYAQKNELVFKAFFIELDYKSTDMYSPSEDFVSTKSEIISPQVETITEQEIQSHIDDTLNS